MPKGIVWDSKRQRSDTIVFFVLGAIFFCGMVLMVVFFGYQQAAYAKCAVKNKECVKTNQCEQDFFQCVKDTMNAYSKCDETYGINCDYCSRAFTNSWVKKKCDCNLCGQ